MLQSLIRYPELAEFTVFNESSAPFKKNSNTSLCQKGFGVVAARYDEVFFPSL